MKNLAKVFSVVILIFSAVAFTSCKDKENTTTEINTTTITEDTISTTIDTTHMKTLNDSM